MKKKTIRGIAFDQPNDEYLVELKEGTGFSITKLINMIVEEHKTWRGKEGFATKLTQVKSLIKVPDNMNPHA